MGGLNGVDKLKTSCLVTENKGKIAAFQTNSRSGRIGTISPNSASLTATKALSLHLLLPIDLESPSLRRDFEFVPSLLPISLPARSSSSSSSLHTHHTCILTKCASFGFFFFFGFFLAPSLLLPESRLLLMCGRKWRLYWPPHHLFRITCNGDALMTSCLGAAKQMASNK